MSIVIATENLSKRYGDRMAVDHLSLEVSEGQIFGFLGPNGAGKSTTIRMLLSLIRPTSGDARIFGKSIRTSYPRYLSQVGALVESADFYNNLSAMANLRMLARLHDQVDEARCREVLEIVGLADRSHDRVKAFSHGMQQRLGIAQAILHRPRLLILDEPSTGLDPQGMHEVRSMIRRLAREEGMTIFLSSHLLNEVEQICTHMAVLREGQLVVNGPVEQFLSDESASLTELTAKPMERARQVLEGLDFVSGITVHERTIRFRTDHDRRPAVVAALTAAGVDIFGIHAVSRLEDYFLSLFGHKEVA